MQVSLLNCINIVICFRIWQAFICLVLTSILYIDIFIFGIIHVLKMTSYDFDLCLLQKAIAMQISYSLVRIKSLVMLIRMEG